MAQQLKDIFGRIRGIVETDSQGRDMLKDIQGRIKGTYDKRDNTTRDLCGRIIGTGDQLSSLMEK